MWPERVSVGVGVGVGCFRCNFEIVFNREFLVTVERIKTLNAAKMAGKAGKSNGIIVRLLSMAKTGYFYTFRRRRAARPMSMLKYDPIVRRHVLFLEQKKK